MSKTNKKRYSGSKTNNKLVYTTEKPNINDQLSNAIVDKFLISRAKIVDLETVEEWMPFPIALFENKYELSNKGRVRNIKKGTIRIVTKKIGYCKITMYHNKKEHTYSVHRMVAKAFIKNPNPKKYTFVNHIDGLKQNNNYKNLEWSSPPDNAQHAVDTGLSKITKRRVGQYDLDGKLIKIYESQAAAAKSTGIDRRNINRACKGNNKFGGYIWKNMDIDANEQIVDLSTYKQIKKFPNYWVNDNGDVYSTKTKKFRRTKIKNTGTVYIQLTKPDPNGGQTIIEIPVQNLVAKYFVKKSINKKFNFIKHKDGNKQNNCSNNLEWCYMPSVKHILEI